LALIQNPESVISIPHNLRYHAEIQIETETSFAFTHSAGTNIDEFIEDINFTLKDYKDREPNIVSVWDQQLEKDITDQFLHDYKKLINGNNPTN